MALDVLPAEDSALWWVQRPEAPLQIAGAAVFEGARLRDRSGSLRFDDVAARIESSLDDTPRFRQRLRQLPLAMGVAWEDDPRFDLANHVRRGVVPQPGGDEELRAEVARLLGRPLDPDRPLWEVWLLDGLAGGRVGLLVKASHVLLDGMALLELALRLLDPTPTPRPRPPAPPWHPRTPSGALARFAVGATARLSQSATGYWQAAALATDRRVLTGSARAAIGAVGAVAHPAGPATARPPLTGRVGSRREVAWTHVLLGDLQRVARATGASVNDVVLAMVTGALDDYLAAHPSDRPARPPRVIVPISVHGAAAGDEIENRFSVTVTELPLGLPEPLDRLARIHGELGPRKVEAPSSLGGRVFALVGAIPPWLVRAAGRLALDHQPVADLAVTDLRGPDHPMYLLGARMLEMYPLVGGTGNIATIVGVLSYDGRLGISVTVDPDIVVDPQQLVAGCRPALRALVKAAARPPQAVAGTDGRDPSPAD